MTKFLNISTDNTLGGNSASDEVVSSQKATKGYIDSLTLEGLSNTTISSPTDGQALVYDSNTSTWVNSSINVDLAENITYSSLMGLINANSGAGNLVPGKLYRITDYVTTVKSSLTGVRSAGHDFDLIVLATSPNTLDCRAMAAIHSGDTYFSSTPGTELIGTWQIWYSVYNEYHKWDWADDTNGKGVIYRMIDEKGNDCPYDFKNIQYQVPVTDGQYDSQGTNQWVYTFSLYDSTNTSYKDSSVFWPGCYINTIRESLQVFNVPSYQSLNWIIFFDIDQGGWGGESVCYNYFDDGCHDIYLNYMCCWNTFGKDCSRITLQGECWHNTFGDNCDAIELAYYNQNNSFGELCSHIDTGTNNQHCTFGKNVSNINFKNVLNPSETNDGVEILYVKIDDNNSYINLWRTYDGAILQNIYIAPATNTWTPALNINSIPRGLDYTTTVAKDSNGTVRIYNEHDDVFPTQTGNAGKFLQTNGSQVSWQDIPSEFPSLTGNASKVLAVNSGETGVEWVTDGGSSTLAGLTDTTISNPDGGEVLIYDDNTSKWVNGSVDLSNYMTLNTAQQTSAAKAIFGTDVAFGSDVTQKNLLAVISDSNSIGGQWIGRLTVGAKNKTFIIGTYGNICVMGAHSWTNAQQGTGAAWEPVYINPDGDKAIYLGGSPINGKQAIMVIQNVNANTTGTVKINRSSNLSNNFKDVACWDDNVSKFNNDAGYITASSLPPTVSGTDDGTNWTSLTIGSDTYAIPSGGGSSTLAGLTDTTITTPSSGQVIRYNSSTSKWVNETWGTQTVLRVWTV